VSLVSTDVFVIDMRLRTAKLNGASVRHKMLAGSTWWSFPAGSTTSLRYAPISYDANTQCSVVFAPAHRG
jgi:hypothetical protein